MFTSVILVLIFAIAIGYATFVENISGTEYARQLIYNAKWFELLLALITINFIGSAIRYKIVNKRKFSILLFHLSFILILVGAGITRYFGSEGIMHLREGETSDEIISNSTSVKLTAEYQGKKVEKTIKAVFSDNSSTDFSEKLNINGKMITVENDFFVPNAVETVVSDDQGEPFLSLFVMNENNQGMDFTLSKSELFEYSGVSFSFGDTQSNIHFSLKSDTIYLTCVQPLIQMEMSTRKINTIQAGVESIAQQKTIYKTDNVIFVIKNYHPKGKRTLIQTMPEIDQLGINKKARNGIIFSVSDGEITKKVNVLSSENQVSPTTSCQINGAKVNISYGLQPQKLPFSITLRKFQLDRYAGSNSPSSYASEITVTDSKMKTIRPFRIYMNNILNYGGYRFFQSSYDEDEQGTILSVNHDYWGTLVTYIGYLFLLIGMILTLFNKNSRFYTVIKLSKNLKQKRQSAKVLLIAGLLTTTGAIFAENKTDKKSHIEALNSLLIQDRVLGRIEPLSTYASDLIRKLSKKTTYKNKSSVEVLLGMMSNPTDWQNEQILKVAHAGLAQELGAVNEFVSYNQLFDLQNNGTYKLTEKINTIYQKDPSTRNQYEKELLNVDERLNIISSIFTGNVFTVFPVSGLDNNKWIAGSISNESLSKTNLCPACASADDENWEKETESISDRMMDNHDSACPVSGRSGLTNKPISMDERSENANLSTHPAVESIANGIETSAKNIIATPETLLTSYFESVVQANQSGNWATANAALQALKNYQQLNGGTQLPSKTKVKLEVLYNSMSIFLTLAILYGLIGFVLLVLHIFNILKYNAKIEKGLDYSIYPLALIFVFYSAGLALRWYISGHAPWSNGYESMIFVGWASALSGLIFAHRSAITLAITSLLAATAMAVAGMSWMNPEITNLVPVLKSYWLVVHVAIITSSYGFLAMAAMLGLFNLCLMILRNRKNNTRLNETIQELSYTIELALTIGLFMLTVGTFLGGIWANESWGRYWGWDSKETWALVSILVYSAVIHLRSIPKANNILVLNTLSLLSFSTVIMTYLGVNYYLSGMHSYGQGTPPPIPTMVYFIIGGLVVLIALAFYSEQKQSKKNT